MQGSKLDFLVLWLEKANTLKIMAFFDWKKQYPGIGLTNY